MTSVRRAAALLLALCLALPLAVSLGQTGFAADTTSARGSATDGRLSERECALTGRVWVKGSGCARHRCVAGAVMFKEGYDAELCRMAGRTGAEYARPIAEQRCADLDRVWLGEINSCASNPNRARRVVLGSARCVGAATTYINHSEEEGYYDECVTPHRAKELLRIAKRKKISLNTAALDRSRANCGYRSAKVLQDGVCVDRVGPPTSDLGGLLMVGDSVSWRADDELNARQRKWEIDLRPGRRLDELGGRLDLFRANHGDPTQLIVQLGTNRRRGFNESDFRDVMATVPATTPVMFLLPFRELNDDNEGPVAATKKYARWMRNLAADRPLTCLVDWPTYASKHLSNLVDGEHPDSTHEDWYARYVGRSWDRCAKRL